MNNEPVAYGKYLEEHDYWVTASGIIPNPKEGYVPLYTHPAKTLTDEEIEQVGKETMLLQFFQSIEATADHGDSIARAMTAMIRQQAFDFARAILRKAQEK